MSFCYKFCSFEWSKGGNSEKVVFVVLTNLSNNSSLLAGIYQDLPVKRLESRHQNHVCKIVKTTFSANCFLLKIVVFGTVWAYTCS